MCLFAEVIFLLAFCIFVCFQVRARPSIKSPSYNVVSEQPYDSHRQSSGLYASAVRALYLLVIPFS